MGKFMIRTVNSGLKFDLYAANGQSILTSEVYTTEHACRKGIESVRKNATIAKLEDPHLSMAFSSRAMPCVRLCAVTIP